MTTLAAPAPIVVSAHVGSGHDSTAWDRLVESTPGTDVTQLSVWAHLRAQVGYECLRIHATCEGDLVGGAQILVRRLPVLGRVGYVPYGPVVAAHLESDARELTEWALAQALHRITLQRLRALFVQPPEAGAAVTDQLLQLGFRRSAAGIAPGGSVRIDLHDDLADIRARFGKRLRSWTNRWADHGVHVRRGTADDLDALLRLMDLAADRRGYRPLPHGYVASLYRELDRRGQVAMFVGEVEGAPVSAELMTGCAGMLRGRLGGFDRSGPWARLSVPAAVHWAMIQWAKAEGYRWFDFGGLEPETLAALDQGADPSAIAPVDQPKLTFGGIPYRYPAAVELFHPAAAGRAFDLVTRSELGRRGVDLARDLLRGTRPTGRRR